MKFVPMPPSEPEMCKRGKEHENIKNCVMLLALLLAAMAVVTMVSADEQSSSNPTIATTGVNINRPGQSLFGMSEIWQQIHLILQDG